ncbi:MAG: hypothetical protein JW881_12470 [Spirochaetales bacterium]|nr:hypothetical protein [Spirochaetales bacterium]
MEYILITGLFAAGFFIVYLFLKRTIKKLVNPQKLIDNIHSEVNKIMAELNNITERNITLIEQRVRELSALLEKADKKILMLQRESEKYSMSKNYSDIIKKTQQQGEAQNRKESDVSIRERVLKLYYQGFSPALIAGRINLPVGEIELIISLEERKG